MKYQLRLRRGYPPENIYLVITNNMIISKVKAKELRLESQRNIELELESLRSKELELRSHKNKARAREGLVS